MKITTAAMLSLSITACVQNTDGHPDDNQRAEEPEVNVSQVEAAIQSMDPYIIDDGAHLDLDDDGLNQALREAGDLKTAEALYGTGEMTPLAEAIIALEASFQVAEDTRGEQDAATPRSTYTNWKWWGVEFWFDGPTATTVATYLKAGSQGTLALLAGLVGLSSGGSAAIIASVGATVMASIIDSQIDACMTDGWIGIRVYWIGYWTWLC